MRIRYFLGALLTLPTLPLMYLQGKRIRASVPELPEATGPEGITHPDAPETLSVLFLGESTMAGVGVRTHAEGFAGTFAQTLGEQLQKSVRWKVYARSGYTARRLAQRMVPKMTESHADLIVISLGGNDAFHLNTPWRWRQNIRELVGNLRQKYPQTPIVFANMPPIKDFPAFTPLIKNTIGNLVEILGHELKAEITQHSRVFFNHEIIRLADWLTRLNITAQTTDFFSDGVHPSALTYQIWARDLATFTTTQVFKNQP
jgi:lysophospholipase L1-like esterase